MLPTSTPGATTRGQSAWAFVSWLFFGLVMLAALAGAIWAMALHPADADPQAGPSVGIFTVAGLGLVWMVALTFAVCGAVCGVMGVVNPASRSGSAWAALALNGAVVVLSVLALFGFSS